MAVLMKSISAGLAVCALLMTHHGVAQKRTKRGKDEMSATTKVAVVQSQPNEYKVLINGKHFTSYRWMDSVYKPVLWPILTPSGYAITRGWPMDPKPGERVDHPHHVGSWFNHGDVNGHDFWNNSTKIGPEHKGPFGKVLHKKVTKTCSGDKGCLEAQLDWLDFKGQPMLREEVSFEFYETKDGAFAFERTSKLTALKEAVVFKDNKEGMFAIRLSRGMEQPSTKAEVFLDANGIPTTVPANTSSESTGKYLASSGRTGDDVWGKAAQWVAMQGTPNGKPTAVCIINHPGNALPGTPADKVKDTYWHARGYGLFGVNPVGAKVFTNGAESSDFTLAPGQSRTFKFKVVVAEGESAQQANYWQTQADAFATKK